MHRVTAWPRGVVARTHESAARMQKVAALDAYGYSLGSLRLQPGIPKIAALDAYGYSLGCLRLQPGRAYGYSLGCLRLQPGIHTIAALGCAGLRLKSSVASQMVGSTPHCRAYVPRARLSRGKQGPPKPKPALRHVCPGRQSDQRLQVCSSSSTRARWVRACGCSLDACGCSLYGCGCSLEARLARYEQPLFPSQ